MLRLRTRLAPLALALVVAATTHAAAPKTFRLQGRLETSGGSPVNGVHDLHLRLYDVPTGGTAMVIETDTVTFDADGVFATTFGDLTPLDPALHGQALWIGISYESDPEMTPRVALEGSPYAIRASAAETLVASSALSLSGFRLLDVGAPTAPGDAATKAYTDAEVGAVATDVGDLGSLTTTATGSLVAAVNEVHATASATATVLTTLPAEIASQVEAGIDAAVSSGVESIVLPQGASTFTPFGARMVNLYGSEANLPLDVIAHDRFLVDLDLDDSAGTATATIEEGSPAIVAAHLDLSTPDASGSGADAAISFPRDDGNFNESAGTVRMLVATDFSANPTGTGITFFQATTTSNSSNRYSLHYYRTSQNYIGAWAVNSGGSTQCSVFHQVTLTEGQVYELEFGWQWGVGCYLFLDGQLVASDGTVVGGTSGTGGKLYLGGMSEGSGIGPGSSGRSDHHVYGFQVFDAVQHTSSYTPTGLAGAGQDFETLLTIDSTHYAAGKRLDIHPAETGRFTLQAAGATPGADELALVRDWSPVREDDVLALQFTGTHWQELTRAQLRIHGTSAPSTLSVTATTVLTPPAGAEAVDLVGGAALSNIAQIESAGYRNGDRLEVSVSDIGTGISLIDAPSPSAQQLALNGTANLTTNSVVVLRFNGTFWQEVSRSIN